VIQKFQTLVNPALFGFSKICYLTLRDVRTKEETLSRLRLFGELLSETYCVGGISLFGIAIKEEEEEKIPLLNEALEPTLIQNMVMGQPSVTTPDLGETDLKIIWCLVSDPKAGIHDIAKRVSVSSKTVGKRLSRMKESGTLKFCVNTDPLRMSGSVRFGMMIRLEEGVPETLVAKIQEILASSFSVISPFMHQKGVINCQVVAENVFEIDPVREDIDSLKGVAGSEVFMPSRVIIHQGWILKEIEARTHWRR
jgi:DNA-binding Lrp family transcriptional regulator